MPHISYEKREIAFKLVYCGPGMSGKTTNLRHIHGTLAARHRGDLISLDTEQDRTLFFDFLPLEIGRIAGYGVRFNMYTVPGQVRYEASRRLILDGADGVVFVADSQPSRFDENVDSYRRMLLNLEHYNPSLEQFPTVLQYNKRDASPAVAIGSLEGVLGLNGAMVTQAVATRGVGVMDTVRLISREIIKQFRA